MDNIEQFEQEREIPQNHSFFQFEIDENQTLNPQNLDEEEEVKVKILILIWIGFFRWRFIDKSIEKTLYKYCTK